MSEGEFVGAIVFELLGEQEKALEIGMMTIEAFFWANWV